MADGVSIRLGPPRRKTRWRAWGAVAVVAILAAVVFTQLRVGEAPALWVETDVPALGADSFVRVGASAPVRGVAHVAIRVQQRDLDRVIFSQAFPTQPAWAPWRPVPRDVELSVPVGADAVEGLEAGTATLTVTARGAGTLARSGPETVEEWSGPVLLRPPSLVDLSPNTWVAQGGAEAVVYRVGATAHRHGVEAGEYFFPGARRDELGEGRAFALFAVPHDFDGIDRVRLVAEDVVGNRAEVDFVDRFERRPLKRDTIRINDRIMEAVVPDIMARTPGLEDRGSLLKNYLQINGDLRVELSARLLELGRRSLDAFTWTKPFVQMPAQVVSAFADRRTYTYEGDVVDRQDHLGFDLASVKNDDVPAANAGRVVLAEYFGIYGNTVIIDHGHGLMTLYAHLSTMDVEVDDDVQRGQRIGATGATGLALGDHLHFTTLIRGVPTTPIEWWDGHWIRDRIASKLGAILEFEDD